VGDRLVVGGSPHRNPDARKLTLLAEIRRAVDGWAWRSTQDK